MLDVVYLVLCVLDCVTILDVGCCVFGFVHCVCLIVGTILDVGFCVFGVVCWVFLIICAMHVMLDVGCRVWCWGVGLCVGPVVGALCPCNIQGHINTGNNL